MSLRCIQAHLRSSNLLQQPPFSVACARFLSDDIQHFRPKFNAHNDDNIAGLNHVDVAKRFQNVSSFYYQSAIDAAALQVIFNTSRGSVFDQEIHN